jgi:hypothetical protein
VPAKDGTKMQISTTGRQAITTKFMPCTNTKCSRVKASCERGNITISWDHALNSSENHEKAVKELLTKFEKEDIAKWGQAMFSKGTWFGGATETGYIFVQVP